MYGDCGDTVNEDGIVAICETLDLKCGKAYVGTATWGSHMSISCPIAAKQHGDPYDDNMSCSVEVVDGGPSRVKCWSGNCRFKGTLLSLIKLAVGIRESTPELVKMLKKVEELESISLSGQIRRLQEIIDDSIDWKPPVHRDRDVLSEKVFDPFSGKIPQYAIDRGITVATAKEWGLGYDEKGSFLVFPVRRTDGCLVGMVGRAVSGKAKRRHHNYMGLDKSKHLFGSHMIKKGKPVVIVESCIDTLNTWQALEGNVNVVATLGEGFSSTHALTIGAARPPFVYIFTDGDQAGCLMGNKIAYALKDKGLPIRIMECPWGPPVNSLSNNSNKSKLDPSNLPYDLIRSIFRKAPIVQNKIKWSKPPPVFISTQLS
jgi:5S rRNA maturation endonuclease (ribonuclease M5)